MLFSRTSGKRKLYRSSERTRWKTGQDIINGLDVSSDEETESLERKLARLRKEVAEVKGDFERQRAEKESGGDVKSRETADEIDGLTQVLDAAWLPTVDGDRSAVSRQARQLDSTTKPTKSVTNRASSGSTRAQGDDSNLPFAQTATFQDDHELSKVADFEARISLLEAALGIDAIPLPTQDQSYSKAVLPTLDTLDKKVTLLSSSTDTSIDKIRSRVRELSQEAETLEQKRHQAKRAQEALSPQIHRPGNASSNGETKDADSTADAEQVSKINALYGTLNTIESLAPILPPVVDRLRSLRLLHADAATASQTLASMESRQADMQQELHGWREGLEKVEAAMRQGEVAMKGNTEVVEGWVKELEGRMRRLP